MKKILFLSLFISFKMLGQSVLLTPNTISKQNSVFDDITIQSYSTYPGIIGIRANGTVALPTALASGDIISQLGVRGYNGTTFTTSRANIRFKATQNWTNIANGTAITFETTPDNSTTRTERMVINQDGEVGIGTISPTANLDVVRGTAPDGTAIFRGTTHASHFNYSSTEDTYIRGGINGANVIINDVAGLGNVGIGTTTPTKASLVVDKKIGAVHAIFGENTSGVAIESSYPGISFNGYYNGGRKPLSNGFVGGMAMNPSTGLISIYNTFASGTAGTNVTTQDVLTMDNLGKVGIGISNPQEKLHVVGRIRASNLTGSGNRSVSADANGNLIISTGGIAFSAKKVGASNLNVLPNTSYTIPFSVEEYDYQSSFNNSTGEFTAPISGVYHLDASILWSSSSTGTGEAIMFLMVNGAINAGVITPINLNKSCTTQISRDIQLSSGDVVKIDISQTSATSQLITNTDYYVRFSGHLVFRF